MRTMDAGEASVLQCSTRICIC